MATLLDPRFNFEYYKQDKEPEGEKPDNIKATFRTFFNIYSSKVGQPAPPGQHPPDLPAPKNFEAECSRAPTKLATR